MKGSPLPVTVVGGYLGTGKTTLVNNLLRAAAGRRIAVLVNDFGTTPRICPRWMTIAQL